MNLPVWEIIADLFALLSPLRQEGAVATMEAAGLVEIRSKLRSKLDSLRSLITHQHTERDAYFVLFPITAHCDELVKSLILDTNRLQWPPLQQELYQISEAGDLFYELLDNCLGKPETLPLVFEVYYFCLSDGFRGRHGSNADKLADYRQRLSNRLPQPPLDPAPPTELDPPRTIPLRIPVYVYYIAALLVLVFTYYLLNSLASDWQPIG